MSTNKLFANLKMIDSVAPVRDVKQALRNKFIRSIAEQIEFVNKDMKGEKITKTRIAYENDKDTSARVRVEKNSRVRRWYTQMENGYAVEARYGVRKLVLKDGKSIVATDNLDGVLGVLDTLRLATQEGALDEVLARAAQRPARKVKSK